MDGYILVNGRYALIKSSRVTNITNSNSDFLQTLVDSMEIDEFVLLDPEDLEPHIGDSYSDGVFSVYVPPLAQAKAQKIADFQIDLLQYVEDRYSFLTRVQFMNLYLLAKFQGLTSRAGYLEPGLAWVNSLLAYAASFAVSVQSQTDAATVVAMTWDITANVLANPNITVGAAVSLTGSPVTLNPISATEKATFNAKVGSITPTASTPSRTLDSDFTPNETHAVMVFYTIRVITENLTPTGSVELRSDTDTTPTTVRSRVAFTHSEDSTLDSILSYLVPAGHNVRLVSAGAATISIVHQSEVVIIVST